MTISKQQLRDAELAAYQRGQTIGASAAQMQATKDLEYLKRSGILVLVENIAKLADANAQLATATAHLVDNLGFHA